ncbi:MULTISPECIES: transcription initiation factor IIB family protein [unclassified Haladaptatus]|uniref:transcription initiation factor IIB n=1 Tax=unclassified Haladaptatus TaxID=2622732 RepID=UPI0023E7A690|nr:MULTISPECIES: transcription initiation factor IIB [unclassified Haladaptatus]
MQQVTSYNQSERTKRTQTREQQAEVTCPECGSLLTTDHEHGERHCEECGLVVEETELDHGPEWRAFDSAERDQKSRVGAPMTKMMHDKGLSTTIDWQDKDARGNTLSAKKRKQLGRLRMWDRRTKTRNARDRNLRQALGEIDRMASALGLPKAIRETASVIYRRALEEDLLPGRSIEGMATASLHAAARQAGNPRTVDEMASVTRVGEMEFQRAYRYIVRELDLQIAPPDPVSYVGRFASGLDVSDETERRARELLETAKREGILSGKSPVGLAAASIYAAGLLTNAEITQAEVSEVADISEVTIRNRYRELLKTEQEAAAA